MISRQGEETLITTMGNDEADALKVGDVEEGEISDNESVEEISEEVFRKQDVVASSPNKESKPKDPDTRVWTMNDLYKYQMGGGYVAGLYNLAWARAVKNTPLDDPIVKVEEDNSKRPLSPSSSAASLNSSGKGGKKIDKIIIDDSGDEKEEGELEEGEIDLDSDPSVANAAADGCLNGESTREVEKRVNTIREALASVTVVEAEKSFKGACSKLHDTLESLRAVVLKNTFPSKVAIVDLSLNAIRSVSLVFRSMDGRLKEESNNIFSRLMSIVRECHPLLFSIDQIAEVEAMVSSLDLSSSEKAAVNGKEVPIEVELSKRGGESFSAVQDDTTGYRNNINAAASELTFENKTGTSFEDSKAGLSALRSRGVLLPLLDLHKDHDVDSLPSPTREMAPPLPLHRPGFPTPVRVYESDALKAFSSYQQKFGRDSLLMNDRLPSPTPSGESGEGEENISGEVSSSSTSTSAQPVHTTSLLENSSVDVFMHPRNSVPTNPLPTPVLKTSAKSRDPRLRYVNSETSSLDQNQNALPVMNNVQQSVNMIGGLTNMKKQKVVEDAIQEGPALKRQRIGLENPGNARNLKNSVGSGGWLDGSDTSEPQKNVSVNQFSGNANSNLIGIDNAVPGSGIINVGVGREHLPVSSSGTAPSKELFPGLSGTNSTSLPDLIKNIAVNPTMLLGLIKMGQQQKVALDAQQKHADLANITSRPMTSNPIPGVFTAGPSQSSGIATSSRPAGASQPVQLTASDDSARLRMKPRDPRRALHNNSLQRTGSMGSEQLKASLTPTSTNLGVKGHQSVQKQEIRPEIKATVTSPPDISMLFTDSLKNIASIVSVSQVPTAVPNLSQSLPVQSVLPKHKVVPEERAGAGASTAQVSSLAPRSQQNTWSDVEHLFEGYDDQQKAAIQRERARRLEEQKKMFSANKLCLVLDLDHTLLNSAKFSEVDPVHDEILRKKEEQDREKPQRHLFRFPHMAMWTKLRPGIWNFLEKASQAFELHLYTMGNKLYATEMAKVLDPKGVLFAGRVISRGDDGDPFDGDDRVPKIKDLEGVMGMESSVVIIDDSVRVWPHNKLNLIVVERYIYFPCSRRQFGLLGPSLLEIDHDERPEDGTLACSLGVIERIHQNFFKHESLEEADVRNILASEQRKILAGCRVLFSRVFPVGEANPHLHPLWQTAEQFGAVCSNQLDDQVTHVVANSLGTDKVNWALSKGKYVVHPGWVEASALLYRRANEQDFAIKT
ncbi:unnamed protein product [Linum tenue]|uniref:protein-serine/threonine phosphatase n=1 Tax=Linum tenue TaxID=586396 RepID=A0AAV0H879_9ROSI|nr:unnamed protein product [Linum tenue]